MTLFEVWKARATVIDEGVVISADESGHEGMYADDRYLPTFAYRRGDGEVIGHHRINEDESEEAILFNTSDEYGRWLEQMIEGLETEEIPVMYEIVHTVESYFATFFPGYDQINANPDSMPLDSLCGQDCKRAIDAAVEFKKHIEAAYGAGDRLEIQEVATTCHYICSVYVNG